MKTIEPNSTHMRMLASVRGELWLMEADRIQEFALNAIDATEKAGGDFDLSDFFDLRTPAGMDENGIAHIQIKGSLLNKSPKIYENLGLVTRYETIIEETQAAVDNGARGILYHVDSPGGTVAGCYEAGEAIANCPIPTASHCSGLACSAAYWLVSQTGHINGSPSAEIGNIGAIVSWADCTAFWKDMGVEFKALVSEGADLKSTFHLEPNETQLEFLQERINASGEMFRNAVVTGRGELDPEVWRAGWYSGEKAETLGLADSIGSRSMAYDELLAELEI